MSLPKETSPELFTAQNELKDFLPKDHEMRLFSETIYPLFSDKDFETCYSDIGRSGISPAFLALVLILQWKESLSDVETAQACIMRLDWKIALHLPIEQTRMFDASTLCRFRRRLIENEKMSLVFDKVVQCALKKGFLKKHGNQRLDATHIVKHVNRISTTDLLFRAVKCLFEEIKGKDKGWYATHIPDFYQDRYENPFSSFGLSKEKRGDKQAEIVEDGLLVEYLLAMHPSDKLKELKQVAIMKTIFEENVIIKVQEVERELVKLRAKDKKKTK